MKHLIKFICLLFISTTLYIPSAFSAWKNSSGNLGFEIDFQQMRNNAICFDKDGKVRDALANTDLCSVVGLGMEAAGSSVALPEPTQQDDSTSNGGEDGQAKESPSCQSPGSKSMPGCEDYKVE